ncbi:MAG TPA: toll/interleukin-1 receptor domain-containing protein, partial [Planctomycetaceae bacterium]|nr:toll/interleukin-1 receptor domain-containing protein [Planctomycetaceae bacterium]
MPGVFISYRREDSSAWAGRLFDIMSARFGRENIFMDLDGIEGGDDFVTVIEKKLQISDVLLAVIGNDWVTAKEASGTRRLDNPRDFVRLEIGKALERNIRVVPVLVGGAAMPRAEDLPQDLRDLSERQAVEIRDSHFHQDAEQLLTVLHKSLRGPLITRRRLVAVLAAVAVVVLLACGMLLFWPSAKAA